MAANQVGAFEVTEAELRKLGSGDLVDLLKNRDSAQSLIRRIIANEDLVKFAPYFASISLSPQLLELLAAMVKGGNLPSKELSILALGRVLEPLPPSTVRLLLDALRNRDIEGAFVALDLLSMYLHGNQARQPEMVEIASQILRTGGLLRANSATTMTEHHFETIAAVVLNSSEFGVEFARYLTEELLVVSEDQAFRSDRLKTNLAGRLVEKFPDIFLTRLAQEIEKGTATTSWRLEHLLGSRIGRSDKETSPFFKLDRNYLAKLCEDHPKRFALFIARVAPLFASEKRGGSWTNVALMLFDKFGGRTDILSEMTANLHTGSWSGPTSQYLRRFLPPLKELFDHKRAGVRRWAKHETSMIEKQIDAEIIDEEERALRRG